MGSVKQMLIEEMDAAHSVCGCGVTTENMTSCVRCGEHVARCATCQDGDKDVGIDVLCEYCANIDDGD